MPSHSSDNRPLRIGALQRAALEDTDRVLREVRSERAHQYMKWGWGRSEEDIVGHDHDDHHEIGDWTRFSVRFLGRAEQAIEDEKPVEWRRAMLQVAALAVAAVEAYDRLTLADVGED